ncbi:hypothetical protein CBL_10134 [Carabus blaptoides fortunei]
MFYNIDLLCRKRQGKFAIIWFAATRGIKHVPRNDVQRVDMFAKLIYGAVLIYKQQYVLLEQQICTFMFLIRRPLTLFNLKDDQDEGTCGFTEKAEIGEDRMEKRAAQSPILAGRSPSKRRRLDDGAAQEHTFPEVNIVQRGSLSPDMTLTEILRQGDQPMDVDREQGAISPDLRMSRRLVGHAATQSANVPRQPAEPAAETAGADTAITTVQEPREAAMPPAPEELSTPPPPPPGRRRVIRTPRPRPPRQINQSIETPSRWRRGNVNGDFETYLSMLGSSNILENRRGSQSSTPTRYQDPRDILRELLGNVGPDNDTDYMSLVLKDKSAGLTMDSVPAIEITGVTDQHNKTYLVPAAEQADVAALPQHGHELLIPEVQPAHTEHVSRIEQQAELPQIDVSAEYRQTLDRNGPECTRPRRYHSTLNLRGNGENAGTPLKIEQLCVPLNRYKMATTFCALLSLEAKQYIVMQSAPDTVELDVITPGPRLWNL